MSNGKAPHRFAKGEPNNNLVVSGRCLDWAKENGWSSVANQVEAMVSAYRSWQAENGRTVALLARPTELLQAQAERARKRLEQYEAALARRELNG